MIEPARELLELQRGLYLAMSEVATPRADLGRLAARLDAPSLERLDQALETVKRGVRIEGRFVIPGETRVAAAADHARTVMRRAERRVVACVDAGLVAGPPPPGSTARRICSSCSPAQPSGVRDPRRRRP
jgi:cob(I)alamin adenosyltransferase